jgi:RHS repeat-associated protein
MRTDPGGNVAATYTNLPFGDGSTQTVGGTGVDQDNNSFTSLELDTETETYHAQFRQYGPAQGSWMSPDPYSGSYDMNNPQSFNRYSYVLNNPLTFTDPSGLVTCGDCDPDPDPPDPDPCGEAGWCFDGGPGPGSPTGNGPLLPTPPAVNVGNGIYTFHVTAKSAALAAPATFCTTYPTLCTIGTDISSIIEAITPVAAATLTLLSMEGDNNPKPTDAECHVIVQNAKDICTNKYPFAGARGNQLGAWRACVRQIVEPTGCDF